MPMPPWSWAVGHIGLLYAYTRSLPAFANVNLVFPEIAASFADTEMFLIDLWPVAETMLIVFNPEAAMQVAQKMNLPKATFNHVITAPITGGPSMLSMNGSQWKTWRSLFNPGFSSAMMVEQTPQIVDSVSVFCKKLVKMTEKGVFSLDNLTTRLTFDIIMKVTLNADADHQSADHPLPYALDMITKWHSVWDVRLILNPLRPLIHAYYGNVIKTYIRKQIQDRFQEVKKEYSNPASLAISRAKSVMTLAIEGYLASQTKPTAQTLDEDFAKMASHQIRLFLFAGNDTTSSTIYIEIPEFGRSRKPFCQNAGLWVQNMRFTRLRGHIAPSNWGLGTALVKV
ncbi:hypothetical protein SLS60_003606 [Paraconiothyrium brasiliense]|uniref:Cytochrome P450 n=1 Tax=Paraconiothyrium brasiliense TaxID=300254 RepID=A0ABR3RP42_9PLEO